MKLTVEFETKRFNAALHKFIKKSNLSTDIVIKKVAFDLLSIILKPPPKGRHPVLSGRSRAAWYPSVQGLGKKFDFSAGVKGQNKVAEGKNKGDFNSHLGPIYLDKFVEMINSVDYILFLEMGSSQQAPWGMVRVALRKLRGGKMPWELEKKYQDDWKKIFGSTI